MLRYLISGLLGAFLMGDAITRTLISLLGPEGSGTTLVPGAILWGAVGGFLLYWTARRVGRLVDEAFDEGCATGKNRAYGELRARLADPHKPGCECEPCSLIAAARAEPATT